MRRTVRRPCGGSRRGRRRWASPTPVRFIRMSCGKKWTCRSLGVHLVCWWVVPLGLEAGLLVTFLCLLLSLLFRRILVPRRM